MKRFYRSAFTLVEVLITVSIIGLLASLTLVSFGGSQKSARDTQRKSDLKQYATALENFANRNSSLYPERNITVSAKDTLCGDLTITTCPEDPKNSVDASFEYRYQSDGSASSGDPVATKYVLWGKIEKASEYWIVCSDGKVGVAPQTGFTVSGGDCPI